MTTPNPASGRPLGASAFSEAQLAEEREAEPRSASAAPASDDCDADLPATPASLQQILGAVFDSCKQRQADDVLPILRHSLITGGFEVLDRHVVYGWAEEISAGIRPEV